MNTELQTTNPAEAFRAVAAERFHAAADMTLHQLCDEFLRLTKLIEAGTIEGDQSSESWAADEEFTDEAKIALRERNIVNGAARARFGMGFDQYDQSF